VRKVHTEPSSQRQVVSTIAGANGAGYNGDGMDARFATINLISSIWGDTTGNLYITDMFNYRIRKLTPDPISGSTGSASYIISTVAGNGKFGLKGNNMLATKVQLKNPFALWGDRSNANNDNAMDLYFVDRAACLLRVVTGSNGYISTLVGTPGRCGYNGDGLAGTATLLDTPLAVAGDGSGVIFIADGHNHRIRKYSLSTRTVTTIAGFGSNGKGGFNGDGLPGHATQLNLPSGLWHDGASRGVGMLGRLFFSEYGNQRVRILDLANGVVSVYGGSGAAGYGGEASEEDALATVAKLNQPAKIYGDEQGRIFLADSANHRIRMLY
jgi:hypothetical protein